MGLLLYINLGLVCFILSLSKPGNSNPTRTLDDIMTKLNPISGEHEHIMEVLQELTESKLNDKDKQQCDKSGKLTKDIAATLKYLRDKLDMADAKMLEGSGATYVRWGRTACPTINGTIKIYDGFAGGDWYQHHGGPSELLCLPREPVWGNYDDRYLGHAFVYGTEYEPGSAEQSERIFGKNVYQQNVPCVVCQSIGRMAVLKIPGRVQCFAGWTKEYYGYLMGGAHDHAKSSDYTCVDSDPEVVQGSGHDQNGHLLYFVEANCGEHSLPCPPYVHGREMPCVICTK